MEIDEIAYLDQLYELAQTEAGFGVDAPSKTKFQRIVFDLWPEISAAFDELKHSL